VSNREAIAARSDHLAGGGGFEEPIGIGSLMCDGAEQHPAFLTPGEAVNQ